MVRTFQSAGVVLVLLAGCGLTGFGAVPRWANERRDAVSSAQEAPALSGEQDLTAPGKSGHLQIPFPQLGEELVSKVEENFYDVQRAKTWSAAHRGYADQITDTETFVLRTSRILADLHSSHTGYYRPTDLTYLGLMSIFESMLKPAGVWYDSIGVDLAQRQEGYFVRTVFAGSPAANAGLRRGDLLLSADGKRFAPITSFQNRQDQPVTLQVQRQPHSPAIAVTVRPQHVKPREEWLQAQKSGTRIVTRSNRRIAYIPMFSGAGEEVQNAVQDAIAGLLQKADALILDFRNGFGGFNPDFVSLFDPGVPALTLRDRTGKSIVLDRHWRKPLYVLINNGSHSGKEVVAFALQKHHRAILLGERTGGAVLGGRPFLLSDGSLLYLAVTNGEVDGQRLEGKGVKPDREVADVLPFAQGEDRPLEAALNLAAGKR
ncbi:MAG: ctpA [Chthonomonadales bacterium]|nr:ctpA [Chthonomonadales bacterium]